MRIETTYKYIAFDATEFTTEWECEEYEEKRRKFLELIKSKIGNFLTSELIINQALTLNELPAQAPWLSAFGACFVNITDIRRDSDRKLEFQIADEDLVPYDNGTAWVKKEDFYEEWPD